jgi:hypothetical protein
MRCECFITTENNGRAFFFSQDVRMQGCRQYCTFTSRRKVM